MIEYTVRNQIREVISLTLHVKATSNPKLHRAIYITENNLATPQFIDIPNASGTVKIQARGYQLYAIAIHYLHFPALFAVNVDVNRFVTPPAVRAFSVLFRLSFSGRNNSHINYDISSSWTNQRESNQYGMAVLDVAVPTGYYIKQQVLDDYILSRKVRNLRLAKFLAHKVVFYFDALDDDETCVKFTLFSKEKAIAIKDACTTLRMKPKECHRRERKIK